MSRLTWQNVAAPDFSGAAQSQYLAGQAMDKALGRVSGAITAFDNGRKDQADAAVLMNAMKFQDANKLQEAIASGQLLQGVNPEHVRAEALMRAQGQVGDLMKLDTSRERLRGDVLTNDHRQVINPLIEQAQAVNNAQDVTLFGQGQDDRTRMTTERAAKEAAQVRLATAWQNPEIRTPDGMGKLYNSLDMSKPEDRAFAEALKPQMSPEFFKALPTLLTDSSSLGSIGGVPGAAPTASAGGTFDITKTTPLFQAVAGGLGNYDKTYGLPPGTMQSVMFQEVGNNPKFLKDPAAYHYELNSEGKRIAGHTGKVSTAFGPFGILESTAKDPGFGVKPLQNKSLEEQTRFASEYLAARIKAAGGDLQKGLAGYGEGVEYASQVTGRMGNVNPAAVPTTQQRGAENVQANLATVDDANRSNVAGGQRIVKAMSMALTNPDDVSLNATLNRHLGEKGAFAGMNKDNLSKLLVEANQELGGQGNFEVLAQVLMDEPTENLGSWRNWVPGTRDSGRSFDPDSVRKRIRTLKQNGGLQTYTQAAKAYDTQTTLQSNESRTAATVKAKAALDAVNAQVASGAAVSPDVVRQFQQQFEEAARAESVGARGQFTTNAPAALVAPTPVATRANGANVPPKATPAPAASTSANNFYGEEQTAARAAKRLATEAQAAATPAQAPASRLVTGSWYGTQMGAQQADTVMRAKSMTSDSISSMTKEEAQNLARDTALLNQLPRKLQQELRRKAYQVG